MYKFHFVLLLFRFLIGVSINIAYKKSCKIIFYVRVLVTYFRQCSLVSSRLIPLTSSSDKKHPSVPLPRVWECVRVAYFYGPIDRWLSHQIYKFFSSLSCTNLNSHLFCYIFFFFSFGNCFYCIVLSFCRTFFTWWISSLLINHCAHYTLYYTLFPDPLHTKHNEACGKWYYQHLPATAFDNIVVVNTFINHQIRILWQPKIKGDEEYEGSGRAALAPSHTMCSTQINLIFMGQQQQRWQRWQRRRQFHLTNSHSRCARENACICTYHENETQTRRPRCSLFAHNDYLFIGYLRFFLSFTPKIIWTVWEKRNRMNDTKIGLFQNTRKWNLSTVAKHETQPRTNGYWFQTNDNTKIILDIFSFFFPKRNEAKTTHDIFISHSQPAAVLFWFLSRTTCSCVFVCVVILIVIVLLARACMSLWLSLVLCTITKHTIECTVESPLFAERPTRPYYTHMSDVCVYLLRCRSFCIA